MSKVFRTFNPLVRRDSLETISREHDNALLINMFGNSKASTFKENEQLAYIYALMLTDELSKKFDARIRPYATHGYFSGHGIKGTCGFLNIYLLEVKPMMRTKYYGDAILQSTIAITEASIDSNNLKFYESRKPFSFSTSPVFDVVKSVSDNFAKAANLVQTYGAKEYTMENEIMYVNRKKK
ncbi:MAG: hypothetical protein ACP5OA_03190 [Candidatus Woesearchaeota archaeon]